MEGYKHFSHTHNLNHYQVPEGTKISCNGCNSLATGTVYVCRKCNFFLHENCYRAARSLKHPSHPSHPLTLAPYPTYPSNSFFCNACKLIGTGFSYSCSHCQFDLHVQCAYNTISNSTPHQPQHTHSFIPTQTPGFSPHQPQHTHSFIPTQTPGFSPHQPVIPYYQQMIDDTKHTMDLQEQLAIAQMESKMQKRHHEFLLSMYDPPGTKYKYEYI